MVTKDEALDKKAENARELGLDYEPDEWLTGCPECGMDSGCDCGSGTWNPPAVPVHDSVAWGVFEGGNLHDMFFSKEEAEHMALLKGSHAEVRPLYTTPPAAPVQEPVAFFDPQGKGFYWAKPTKITAPVTVDVEPLPLYTTPPAGEKK